MNLEISMSALTAKLEKCRAEVVVTGKMKALRAGGKVIRDAMISRAPVLDKKTANSTSLEPGALKAGLRTYVHEADGDQEALIGPSSKVAHVARWVEYGHRRVSGGYLTIHGRGPGKISGEDIPAHPFLRPAFEESYEAALEAERLSLAATIQEQVR